MKLIATTFTVLSIITLLSCEKKGTNTQEEPTIEPPSSEEVYDPIYYPSYILFTWEVDSSTYWSGNNPNYNNEVIHYPESEASYRFEYNLQSDLRTVFFDSGNLINGTAFGYHSFPYPNDPTHLYLSIFGGKDIYIRYLSDERMEWIQYDPSGNGYTDSLATYLHR